MRLLAVAPKARPLAEQCDGSLRQDHFDTTPSGRCRVTCLVPTAVFGKKAYNPEAETAVRIHLRDVKGPLKNMLGLALATFPCAGPHATHYSNMIVNGLASHIKGNKGEDKGAVDTHANDEE